MRCSIAAPLQGNRSVSRMKNRKGLFDTRRRALCVVFVVSCVVLFAGHYCVYGQTKSDFPDGFDAVQAAPKSHKVVFLNAFVRVLEVSVSPGTTVPMHHHRWPSLLLIWDIPGDFLEAGVWRGGATIFMKGMLAAYGVHDRRVWVADSFRGLPVPDEVHFPQDVPIDQSIFEELAVSQEQVRANFARYDLLDDQVLFLEGWFKDTLPTAPVDALAVLRLDGDYYESPIQILESLYHKVSPGGFVIVDDYGCIEACRQGVSDFRAANGIEDPIVTVD